MQYLLSSTSEQDGCQLDSQSISAASANGIWFTANGGGAASNAQDAKLNIAQMPVYSYAELLALYDKERTLRLDLESSFQQKSKEFNKQVNSFCC